MSEDVKAITIGVGGYQQSEPLITRKRFDELRYIDRLNERRINNATADPSEQAVLRAYVAAQPDGFVLT